MEVTHQSAVPISDPSQVAEARRVCVAMAEGQGFDEADAGRVALVATEVATNLCRHAVKVRLLLARRIQDRGQRGVEILAIDRGPGMASTEQCLRDGFSTTGTHGTGLGAVRRLSNVFDLYSRPGEGTVLLAQVWPSAEGGPRACPLVSGGLSLPKPGELVSGDCWGVASAGGRCQMIIVDGLGHGEGAARASQEAMRLFHKSPGLAAAEIVGLLHRGLRSTRGAAMAIAEVELSDRRVTFAGIGNVSAEILSDGKCHAMVSHAGIVGHQVRRIESFEYPWPLDALMVMHSDGCSTKWDLSRYPGLAQRHPSVIAGVLYRDFGRPTDDVTVAALSDRALILAR